MDADQVPLNFPEKYYVGVQNRDEFSTILNPLAFATPYGTDSAYQNRKATVDRWVGGHNRHNNEPYNGEIIDNVPLEGYKIQKSVTRYETSNKYYRIEDPRGFTLEISVENLLDLMLNGSINKGEIVGKHIWGRHGSKMWLTRLDHPSYLQFLQPRVKKSQLDIGDVIIYGRQKQKYAYLGTKWVMKFDLVTRYVRLSDGYVEAAGFTPSYVPYYFNRTRPEPTHEWRYFITTKKESKSVILLQDVKPTDRKYLPIKSIGKAEILSEKFNVTQPEANTLMETAAYNKLIFFDSKKELEDFQLTNEQIQDHWNRLPHTWDRHVNARVLPSQNGN